MTFIVLEKYCKDRLGYYPTELLGICKGQWYEYKKKNYLPLKHCKTICSHFNHHITDDMKELTDLIASAYYVEVTNGN